MFKGIDGKYIFEQFKSHSMTVIAFVFAGGFFYMVYNKDKDFEEMKDSQKEMTEFWKNRYDELKDIKKEIEIKEGFKELNDSMR